MYLTTSTFTNLNKRFTAVIIKTRIGVGLKKSLEQVEGKVGY